MLAPWALETCSVKDCRANARNDGRFQKGMIFPCRRCRKEVLGRTVGIISLAFLTGWHSARCRDPFFAQDGEWHDAKMGFGNIPKRIDEANYNLWWSCASLKLGIFDSVVEVSLEGTIRLKEAELPRLMGLCSSQWQCTRLEMDLFPSLRVQRSNPFSQ